MRIWLNDDVLESGLALLHFDWWHCRLFVVAAVTLLGGVPGVVTSSVAADGRDSANLQALGIEERASNTGFVTAQYVDSLGERHPYVLFIPHFRQNTKLPVLLFLNGVGENGQDGVNQITNNFGLQIWEMQDRFPFLAVCPQCRPGGDWGANSVDTACALQIVDRVVEHFNGDLQRIYLTGVSAGGAAVWELGGAYPERFAAIVPLCGDGGGDVPTLTKHRMPIWAFCNDGDFPELVEGMQRDRDRLLRAGLSPLLTMYPATGHDCWNAAYRNTALYGWMLDHTCVGNGREPLFNYAGVEEVLEGADRTGNGSWRALDPDVLVGRANGSESLLVLPRSAVMLEVHGDVWLTEDSVHEMVLLFADSSERETQYRVSLMLPDQGGGGVLRHADGQWIAVLDPAAQQGLRPDTWNDVRVKMGNGRLSVRLNGWPAVEVHVGSDETAIRCRVALVAPDDGSEVRWRYVRMR